MRNLVLIVQHNAQQIIMMSAENDSGHKIYMPNILFNPIQSICTRNSLLILIN